MDSAKVKKSKKNKGKAREVWIQQVKDYHAGIPKGKGKGGVEEIPDEDDAPVGGSPTFPNAPWWMRPMEEGGGKEEEKKEESPDVEAMEPLLKRSKKDDDDHDKDGPMFNPGNGSSRFFAIFGP